MPRTGRPPTDPVARFNAKVLRGTAPDSCWEWVGTKNKGGYGVFALWGKSVFAHRLSLAMSVPCLVEKNKLVIHSCDNPSCVNPDHLRMGTAAENSQDMVDRSRNERGEGHWAKRYPERIVRGERHWAKSRPDKLRGENNGRAILGNSDVARIKELVSSGMKQGEVAAMLGVSRTTINNIWTGRTWNHP